MTIRSSCNALKITMNLIKLVKDSIFNDLFFGKIGISTPSTSEWCIFSLRIEIAIGKNLAKCQEKNEAQLKNLTAKFCFFSWASFFFLTLS